MHILIPRITKPKFDTIESSGPASFTGTGRRTVLIIGGGITGASAARLLDKHFNVILVDTKEYVEYYPGLPILVSKGDVTTTRYPHTNYVKRGTVILGRVQELKKNSATLSNGTEVQFDACIIAAGASYKTPVKEDPEDDTNEKRGSSLNKFANKIRSSEVVVIIGGGAVGVELAGDIKHYHKKKRVIIFQSPHRLMESMPDTMSARVQQKLENIGVEIKLGVRFNESMLKDIYDGDNYTLIWCIGQKPNSQFMVNETSGAVNDRGVIKVKPTLQIDNDGHEGFDHIFAIGDCCDFPEAKMAYTGQEQAKTAAVNVYRLFNHWSPVRHHKATPMLMVTCGQRDAVMCIMDSKYFVFSGFRYGWLSGMPYITVKKFLKYLTMYPMMKGPLGSLPMTPAFGK